MLPLSTMAAAPCVEPAAEGGDWPVIHHDTMSTGFQDHEHTIGPDNVGQLEPVWAAPLSGATSVSVTADGGCVFAGGTNVRAFDIDTGEMVWEATVGTGYEPSAANGRVFVQSNEMVYALDQSTGVILWKVNAREIQPHGIAAGGSPLPFEDYVVVGFTGCGEGGAGRIENPGCRGYYAILDQATGVVVADGYDVSDADVARGMEGAGFWGRPGYDPEDKYIYFGEAGPRSVKPQNPYADAMLQIDADPDSPTFGDIVNFFRDTRLHMLDNSPLPACGRDDLYQDIENAFVSVCLDDDDFVTTPVIFRDSSGRKLLGMNHSQSPLPVRNYNDWVVPWGYFFAVDPVDMAEVWRAPATGGRGTLHAYDGERLYYSSGHEGGIFAVDKDTGTIAWRADALGGNSWMHISAANGVVYSLSGNRAVVAGNPGVLLAFDAADGSLLFARPLSLDIGALSTGVLGGGVTIARNTVLVPTGAAGSASGAGGYVVAYRLPG
jgi:outer membrane protein assembly factor BamB